MGSPIERSIWDPVSTSSNFAFLSYFGTTLVEAAAHAELVIAIDPIGALNHLRRFGEALAQAASVRLGTWALRAATRSARAESQSLREELEQLRAIAATSKTKIEEARALAEAEAKKALGVREAEQKALEEREFWEALAREFEAKRNADQEALAAAQQALAAQQIRYEAELAALQAQVQKQSAAEQQKQLELTVQAAAKVNLDEASTRAIIDEQLRAAGWEANTEDLRYSRGTRPEKGRTLAIAEWPTSEGPADYVLFDGLTALAVVEAKKVRKDVAAALEQSKRYASGFNAEHGAQLAGGPWGKYRVPFLFATNGRPYLKQIESLVTSPSVADNP